MKKITRRDGIFLGEETIKGWVFSRTVFSYELICNCGQTFYPKFDVDRKEWIDCAVDGGEYAHFNSVLACSKECLMVMRGTEPWEWKSSRNKKRDIFSTCEYCGDMIPKGKRTCNLCKTKFQDEKKVLVKAKKEEPKKDPGIYQGGSPGLNSGPKNRFK